MTNLMREIDPEDQENYAFLRQDLDDEINELKRDKNEIKKK
jgi:hemerythrin-like domain-containing protein